MTVSSETYRVQYSGNGVTTAFTVPWRFLANSHVLAIHTDAAEVDTVWVEGTHYTLTGAGAATGTLTAKTTPTDYTPATGARLTIVRDLPLTQTTDYVSNDDFPAQTHEDDHDKSVMLIQQLQEQLDRTVRIPKSSTDAPLAEGDAGPFIGATGAPGPTGPGGDMSGANNLSEIVSPSTAFATIKQAASTTATGVVELATDAETITGTDTARAVTPANVQAKVASATALGIVELATDAETITGTDTGRVVTPAGLTARVATISPIGKQTISIPAAAMWPRLTNGATAQTRELTTGGDIIIKAWSFDTTTEQAVQFYINFPKSWNKSTLTFRVQWTNAAGLTTETVSWGFSAGAFTDSDPIDTTDLGTEVRVSDTWLAQNDFHVSAESGAVTVGNTPIDGDMVIGQIARSVANDNMTGGAELMSIEIFYTTNAATDA